MKTQRSLDRTLKGLKLRRLMDELSKDPMFGSYLEGIETLEKFIFHCR